MLRSRLKNIINKSNGISNKEKTVGDPFEEFVNSLPKELDYYKGENYRLKAAWKAYGSPKNYKEALWEGLIQPINESTFKMPSIGYNEENDSYEYLNKGKENNIVAKDIRVWDNDVIPLVKELKLGGYVRTFNEEKDCWTYTKNSQKRELPVEDKGEQVIEEFKSGGKKKIKIYLEGDSKEGEYIEVDSLDDDLKAGRKPIGKDSKGRNRYLNGDNKAVLNLGGRLNGDIPGFLKGGKTDKKEVPSDIFELKNEDYYYWPDDNRALDFIKNNKWFRKEYKQWGDPKDGEKVLLVNRKKYKNLWYDKNKEAIINYIINTNGFSNEYPDIVGDGIPARPTGEFTEDGKELYETPDGLLYTKYEKGGELGVFKQGGLMNVIPEGSLHARKNNMELAEKGEITSKGIPVVDNQGELQAEIEKNEVIFNKDLTDFIENNLKKFNSEETSNSEKDEIAIKVGKRLTKELLNNTDDKTGLIEEVKEKM